MAGHDDSHGDHTPGTMDISQHHRAYAGFLRFTKWSMFGILLIVLYMAFFRTH